MKHPLISLSFIMASIFFANAANAASEKVLCVNIDGDLFDNAEVLLSNKGIKVRNRLGISLWSVSKPDYIYMANPENKTVLKLSADEYIKDTREDYQKLEYTRLERKAKTLPGGMKGELVTAYLRVPSDKEEVKVAEITCLKNSGLPTAVNRMWCRYMGVPDRDFSLPVGAFQMVFRSRTTKEALSGGRKRWVVVALPKKIERKNLDEQLLQIPKDFKIARDKASLYLSSDGTLNEGDLADFFISTPKKK